MTFCSSLVPGKQQTKEVIARRSGDVETGFPPESRQLRALEPALPWVGTEDLLPPACRGGAHLQEPAPPPPAAMDQPTVRGREERGGKKSDVGLWV